MMRLVLDTNVVVSGLLWDGKPRRLIQSALSGKSTLFSSLAMLDELGEVLAREKFRSRIEALYLPVDEIVDRYADLTTVVRPRAIPRIAPDPDDDVVIGTALAAAASLLVTGDKALLSALRFETVKIVPVSAAILALEGL